VTSTRGLSISRLGYLIEVQYASADLARFSNGSRNKKRPDFVPGHDNLSAWKPAVLIISFKKLFSRRSLESTREIINPHKKGKKKTRVFYPGTSMPVSYQADNIISFKKLFSISVSVPIKKPLTLTAVSLPFLGQVPSWGTERAKRKASRRIDFRPAWVI
jgi:hypothetical protein